MESFIVDRKVVDEDNMADVADIIMNKSHLRCNGKTYRVCEVEFYLLSDSHDDKYTHANPDQLRYGRWYFHKYKTGAYKSGTWKGMDIAMGSKKDDKHCGILIRSIYDVENDKMIEGPCRTVNELISRWNHDNVKEFMFNKKSPLSVTRSKNNRYVYMRDNDTFEEEDIYTTKRIGLSDKFPEWQDVHYRFFIKKNMIKKGKKGIEKLEF